MELLVTRAPGSFLALAGAGMPLPHYPPGLVQAAFS